MAEIGYFGKTIKFEVNSKKVMTFQSLKRTSGGRWAKHNIIGSKPKSEFQGAESGSVEMEIFLSAEHGVKPRTTIDKIIKVCEQGKTAYLVVGGKKIFSRKVYIETVSDTWETVMNKGELVSAKLNIKFTEY